MEDLAEKTNTPIHRALGKLSQSGERPHPVIDIGEIRETVVSLLTEAASEEK